MSNSSTCPQCGASISADKTDGLCPRCLLAAAFEDHVSPELRNAPSSMISNSAIAPTFQPRGSFSAPESSAIASLFPQLEIVEVIGRGGMGAVYKVRQIKLDRLAALKIIRPDSASDPAFAERFNREARTLAKLNNKHIVGVYDFGEVQFEDQETAESQPLYYFLMEYVEGVNLRQVIESGRTSPEHAMLIVPQICEALQYAHSRGIVHRDIKPENILLDAAGHVKIADFGLAKLSGDNADFTLTGTHQILGTVRYMAPEQMTKSGNVDHRADIYSLGVVLYEMLTGEVPAGAFEMPSRRVGSDVRLDSVIMRALASDPGRRYQSAGEVASHISTISSGKFSSSADDFRGLPGVSTIIDNGVAAMAAGIRDFVAGDDRRPDDLGNAVPDDAEGHSGDSCVNIPLEMAESNDLPDVCIVCGVPTRRRQYKEFQHTSDLAGGLIVLGLILFFPIGIVLAILMTRKVRISCPLCQKHRRHWSDMTLFASLGWILIPMGLLAGLYFGGYLTQRATGNPWILIPCILLGVLVYVLKLVAYGVSRVAVGEINSETVRLKRVSTAFARAIEQRKNR
ncbi:MAG: protein kinase [Planctomycetaceae bacterium]|nr:protein kinase [Planctomycetaceae bacterium]